jgi:adenosylcobinamide-phosphate synthase
MIKNFAIVWSAPILLGFLIDLLLGDPHWLPHPVRGMGFLIAKGEGVLRRLLPRRERLAGTLLVLVITGVAFTIPAVILFVAWRINMWAYMVIASIMTWQVLAARCLRDESMKVYRKLKENDLEGARRAVSMIVGRDTAHLSEEQVTKAAVETVAENLGDGVIAPMCYLAIGGPALAMLYKGINTMDSMIGYKNERYLHFGRTAAKLDDVANWIPARLSALFLIEACPLLGLDKKNARRVYRRDRYKHESPNSAHGEAACAGALGVALAGNAYYEGVLCEKPEIGDPLRPIAPEDIPRTARLMYAAAVFFLPVVLLCNFFIGLGISVLCGGWNP